MNLHAILTITTSILCYILSCYIYSRYRESHFHRSYAYGFLLAGFYTFFLFGFYMAETASVALWWLRFSAVVHGIPIVLVHIILQVTRFSERWAFRQYFFIYLPFILFFFQDFFFPELTYSPPVKTEGGWATQAKVGFFHYLNFSIYIIYLLLQLGLILGIIYRHKKGPQREFALFVLFTYLIPFLLTMLWVFVIPLYWQSLVRIESLFVLFACSATIFCLRYFQHIFDLSVEIASKDIIQNMSSFLILLDIEKKITLLNPRAEQVFGYTKEELKGQPLSTIIDVNNYQKILELVNAEAAKGMELSLSNERKEAFPAILTLTKVTRGAHFIGYILIGNDLTDIHNILSEKRILELELRALLQQMNPHFLFNSLNAIQHYISDNDEEKANDYLTKFATLMRRVLECSNHSGITLQEEVKMLRLYLDLEKMRFKHQFSYTIKIEEGIVPAQLIILPMIIQPFVENALWHGLLPKEEAGYLHIHFSQEGTRLKCTVEDDGIGRVKASHINQLLKTYHQPTALRNIEERVKLLNKTLHEQQMRVNIIDRYDDSGLGCFTCAEIYFPIHY